MIPHPVVLLVFSAGSVQGLLLAAVAADRFAVHGAAKAALLAAGGVLGIGIGMLEYGLLAAIRRRPPDRDDDR